MGTGTRCRISVYSEALLEWAGGGTARGVPTSRACCLQAAALSSQARPPEAPPGASNFSHPPECLGHRPPIRGAEPGRALTQIDLRLTGGDGDAGM